MSRQRGDSFRLRTALGACVLGVMLLLTSMPATAQGKTKLSFDDFANMAGAKTTGKFIDDVKKLADLAKKADSGQKSMDEFDKLDPTDSEYDPDFDPPGTPDLPLLCKNSQKCEDCFKEPHQELNSLRFRFEKLRKINRVTKKMLRENIAWGDAASNLAGGLTPLAWEAEKTKIRQSEKNFNASYDAKYQELTSSLLKVLQEISACEEQVFGETGWYERYGFMYYQFMVDAYRRPD